MMIDLKLIFDGGLLLHTAVVSFNLLNQTIPDHERASIIIDYGSDTDDIYIGMDVEVNDRKIGCVHDYHGKTKQLIVGRCFNGKD